MKANELVGLYLCQRYELKELIGAGRFGLVYRALDISLDRIVAVKLLNPVAEITHHLGSEQLRSDFMHEAQLIAGLKHKHIIPVYDYGESDLGLFFVMKRLSGPALSLKEVQLTSEEVLEIGYKLSDAIDYLHSCERPVLHRDIKLSNILLDDGEPVLIDFGLGRFYDSERSATQVSALIKGSPGYAPLEIYHNALKAIEPTVRVVPLDIRTDFYCLGSCLYRLLTGMPPVPGQSTDEILANMNARLPIRPPSSVKPQLGPKVDEIILKLLAYEVDNRYADAESLQRDLLEALNGANQGSERMGRPFREAPLRKQRPSIFSLNRFVLLLLATILLCSWLRAISVQNMSQPTSELARKSYQLTQSDQSKAPALNTKVDDEFQLVYERTEPPIIFSKGALLSEVLIQNGLPLLQKTSRVLAELMTDRKTEVGFVLKRGTRFVGRAKRKRSGSLQIRFEQVEFVDGSSRTFLGEAVLANPDDSRLIASDDAENRVLYLPTMIRVIDPIRW